MDKLYKKAHPHEDIANALTLALFLGVIVADIFFLTIPSDTRMVYGIFLGYIVAIRYKLSHAILVLGGFVLMFFAMMNFLFIRSWYMSSRITIWIFIDLTLLILLITKREFFQKNE